MPQENKDISKALEDASSIIKTWIVSQRSYKRIPGISIGIVHNGNTLLALGDGFKESSSKQNADETTCYRIGSISKLFTAISIMQLVERGGLRLDDNVNTHLEWFKSENDERLDDITIRHLLMHSSGISRDGETTHWSKDNFPHIDDIKKFIKKQPTVFETIKKFKYSNLGYGLLGQVIENVSGKSYDGYVRENILDKLSLTHTSSDLNSTVLQNMAQGYGRKIPGKERELFSNIETNVLASATGFSSNVNDLCKFMIAQLSNKDILLKNISQREMKRPQWIRKKPNRNWGLGYQLWDLKGKEIYGHGGGFPGYITCVGMNDELNLGVVVLTNAMDGGAKPILDNIFNIIFSTIKRYEFENKELNDFKKYEGKYRERWGDLRIKSLNNTLIIYEDRSDQPLEDFDELKHQSGHEFYIAEGNDLGYIGEKVTFNLDENNNAVSVKIGPTTWEKLKD